MESKKVLVVALVAMVALLVLGVNVLAATESGTLQIKPLVSNNTTNNTTNELAGTNQSGQVILSNNTSNNVSTEKVPDTGLADLPWLAIIAVCAISAVFAFKKIKEYKLS